MKSVFHLLFLVCWSALFSQTAVTNDGRKVMLFEDKTWKPYPDSLGSFTILEASTAGDQKVILSGNGQWKFMNKKTEGFYENTLISKSRFDFPKTSTSLAQSKRTDAGFYYDPKQWSITEEQHQYTLGEFSLQGIVNKDLQASFGSSPVDRETTLHDIRNSVLTNLLMNPGHYKIRKTEFRTVNGVEMFYIQFHDVDSGYDIIRNHFITDDLYCATLSAGSPEKAFITHEKEMQSFINGAVKIKTADKLVEIINVQAPLPPPVNQKN